MNVAHDVRQAIDDYQRRSMRLASDTGCVISIPYALFPYLLHDRETWLMYGGAHEHGHTYMGLPLKCYYGQSIKVAPPPKG